MPPKMTTQRTKQAQSGVSSVSRLTVLMAKRMSILFSMAVIYQQCALYKADDSHLSRESPRECADRAQPHQDTRPQCPVCLAHPAQDEPLFAGCWGTSRRSYGACPPTWATDKDATASPSSRFTTYALHRTVATTRHGENNTTRQPRLHRHRLFRQHRFGCSRLVDRFVLRREQISEWPKSEP